MTTDIIITGTGFPVPDPLRAGPGVHIRHGELNMQFDAGRSTVRRIVEAGVGTQDVDAFFATHHHSDHLVGLPDLVMTRWNMGRRGGELQPLDVIVPAGPSERFVNSMLDVWQDDLDVRKDHLSLLTGPDINVIAFDYPEQVSPVWERDGVIVSAGQVRHEPVHPAVGYRVETPDGVVAITGDTLVCDEVALLAADADVLIYEAMLFSLVETWDTEFHPIMDYHADSRLIGAQAESCGVKTLVLTHTIPAPNTNELKQAFIDHIRNGGFTGELLVANDLDVVSLG